MIALLGILTATAMFLINPAAQLQKSRDAKRKSDIKLIQSALELYRSDTGSYVSANSNNPPGVGNCSTNNYASLYNDVQGDSGCATLSNDTVYLQTVPKDPKTSNDYYYCQGASCPSGSGVSLNGYAIYACLENQSDSDRLKSGSGSVPAFLNDATAVGCSTPSTAVYGVSNP